MNRYKNFNAVAEIMANAKRWAMGVYSFTDKLNNKFMIDTLNNKVYRVISDTDAREICRGNKKQNGYKYIAMSVESPEGDIVEIRASIHSIVCMLCNGIPVDYMEPNHKDNCPWNNRPSNLEWSTRAQNARHGKIVASLAHHYPGKYTIKTSNDSGVDHQVLVTGLSVHDIDRFIRYTGDWSYFRVGDDKYIAKNKIDKFLLWLGW